MKKIWMRTVSVLLIALLLISSAFAADWMDYEPALDHVTDAAELLMADEWQNLETKAQEIASAYDFGVYVITVDDYTDYASGSIFEAAMSFYQEYSLGLGEEKNGLLLLLSMDDRDYSLVTYGDFGNYAFNDEGRPLLADFFLDDFGSDDWYTGFSDYLDWSEKYLIAAGNGEPYTNDHSPDGGGSILLKFVVIFLFPLLVAFIYVGTLKAKMKTVAKATEAATYMTSEMNLTEANDRYTHTTETRRTISSDKSNSSNSSSGGFSGTSGKF